MEKKSCLPTDSERVLELAVKAGEMLLVSGAEVFRVQQTMEMIADAYGCTDIHVFVLTNGLFASLHGRQEVRYVKNVHEHYGRVAAVNDLSRQIVRGGVSLDEAFIRLDEATQLPFAPSYMQVGASALGCGCFCIMFGGGWREALCSAFAGAILQLFLNACAKYDVNKIIAKLIGAAIVTVLAVGVHNVCPRISLDHTIIGSIIPLLPGIALTMAVRDFTNSDYLSGTIRLMDALLIAGCIAMGVGFVIFAVSRLSWVSLG